MLRILTIPPFLNFRSALTCIMFKYKTHYKHRQKVTNSLSVNSPSNLSPSDAHLVAVSRDVDQRG